MPGNDFPHYPAAIHLLSFHSNSGSHFVSHHGNRPPFTERTPPVGNLPPPDYCTEPLDFTAFGTIQPHPRVDLGLSQRELAEILAIGISDTAVEKWEKNQNRPTESHRRRIIEFLGFDLGTLKLTGMI